MGKSVGNVEYDENAALYVGASYPQPDAYTGYPHTIEKPTTLET